MKVSRSSGGGADRDGVISAKDQRSKILVERFFHRFRQAFAGAGNFVEVAGPLFAKGLLFGLRDDHIADVFDLAAELL